MVSREDLKNDLKELVKLGNTLLQLEANKNNEKIKEYKLSIKTEYQSWYSRSIAIIKQIMPERLNEFNSYYNIEKRDNSNISFLTYTISDYLLGLTVTRGIYKEEVVNPLHTFISKFQHQISILNSVEDRLDSILSDIKGLLQAELFDNQMEAAKELNKKGHLRAAGTLAGVMLEQHFSNIVKNHTIKISKKDPLISEYNDNLKNNNVYDVPTWRFIQRIGDIRNLCAHSKDREPTKEEVSDMINGVEKIIKTVF